MAKEPTQTASTPTQNDDANAPEYRVLATGAPKVPGDPLSADSVMFHFTYDGDYRDAWKAIRKFLDEGGEVETMVYDAELAKEHAKSKDQAKGWKLSGQKTTLEAKSYKARNIYALQATRGFQRGVTWKQIVERAEEKNVTIPKAVLDIVNELEAEREKASETTEKQAA